MLKKLLKYAPELLKLGGVAAQVAEEILRDRMAETGGDRDKVLAEAQSMWDASVKAADELAKEGHE